VARKEAVVKAPPVKRALNGYIVGPAAGKKGNKKMNAEERRQLSEPKELLTQKWQRLQGHR
jgi:hypothetical protein